MSRPGVTGDFGQLDGLIRYAASFADGSRTRKAVGAIGKELGAIGRECFEAQRSPEGVAWRSLKDARPRGRKALVLSTALRTAATSPRFFGLSVRFNMLAYGNHHQLGAPRAHVPARPWLPSEPLAPVVERRLVAAATAVMKP